MSEVQQPIVKPPLPEFTNPGLTQAAEAMEESLDRIEAEVQASKIVLEAGKAYEDRAGQVDGIACELLDDPEMVQALSTIGEYASKMVSKEGQAQLDKEFVVSESAIGWRRVTMPSSELSRALVASWSGLPSAEQRSPVLQHALNTVWAKAISTEGTEPTPSITLGEVSTLYQKVEQLRSDALIATGDMPNDEKLENAHTLAEIIDDLPSEDTLGVIVGLAYFDTLREFMKENGGVQNGVLKPELRQDLLKRGTSTREIIQAEASMLLDYAGAVSEGGVANSIRSTSMAKALGVKIRKIVVLGDTLDASKLSAHQSVVVNAHNIMLEVHAHSEDAKITLSKVLPIALGGKVPKEIPKILAETTDGVFDGLVTAYEDNPSEEYAQQLTLFEQYKIERERQIAVQLKSLGTLSYDELKPLNDSLEPRLHNFIGRRVLTEQLEGLREFIDGKVTELAPLDAPYAYTSKKIRAYENGLSLIRDLETSLEKRGLNPSTEVLQTLAILINQAETAEDKAAYFDELAQARNQIEAGMAELDFVGARDEYSSPTANALRWIDEIIDAGKEGQVNNVRLTRFIQDYYLGPEPETFEEPAAEEPQVEDSEDELPTEETYEAPEDEYAPEEGEPEPEAPEEEPAPSDEPTPLERYVSTLQDILGDVEIHRADVAVFPPGKTERQRQQREAREENHFVDVDPERLQNLVKLKQSLEVEGKIATLMYTQPTSWSALPHFALYVQQSPEAPNGVCLLENPVNGNASYVFAVDGELIMDWEELARVTKQEARDLGAATFIHPTKGASNFGQHYSGKLKSHIALELASLR